MSTLDSSALRIAVFWALSKLQTGALLDPRQGLAPAGHYVPGASKFDLHEVHRGTVRCFVREAGLVMR